MDNDTSAIPVIKEGDLAAEENKGGKEYVPRSKYNDIKAELKKYQDNEEVLRIKKLEEEGEYSKIIKSSNEKIDNLQREVDEWNAYKIVEKESLLKQLPKESIETFKDTGLTTLRKVVALYNQGRDNKTMEFGSPSGRESDSMGYNTPQEAARAKINGEIDEKEFRKIFNYFKSKAHR